MKNTLVDLNNHLFEQLERLNDDEVRGEKLSEEIERANAMAKIAQKIIDNGNLALRAETVKNEYYGDNEKRLPAMLEG